jgi:ectoine hydroxylase-related dioxygenase (phytanoyl-CoA dioxygenase family)
MKLNQEQLSFYEENGYLLLPEYFSSAEVKRLKAELPATLGDDSQRRVVERDGKGVRSIYGSHTKNEIFRRLSCHPRIVEPARQMLDGDVYVYQFKINAKMAFSGDLWDWHQDFIFWQKEDGVLTDRLINVAVFMDDVNEFNGPIYLIPRSHKEGVLDTPAREYLDGNDDVVYRSSPSWISSLTANIKYSVNSEIISRLVENFGIVAPKGASGSALFFHCNLVHASPNNMSPFNRVIAFVTYNSTANIPATSDHMRPDFLCGRDYRPLVALSDSALLV